MKRERDIIREIVEPHNLYNSISVVLHGKKRKKTRIGRWIMKNQKLVVDILSRQIQDGTFRISGYKERIVTDGPKDRRVQAIPIIERIGINAVMSVVEQRVFRKYIRTTSASIKNRGTHDLLNYIRRDIRQYPEEMRYVYKFDITKFYESIWQDFMMYCLRRMFKDKILLTILERFVRMMPEGLSIGLRSSQGFGNMLLSMFLDHYLKDEKGLKHFYRYCDDGTSHAKTKKECWMIRNYVHQQVELMHLKVKSNERVFPISEGIDFLGYVIYPTHTRLRKRNKKNFARKIHHVKSIKRKRELIASFYGLCKHADCRNLFYRLTGIRMKDFKDLGIKPKYADGKKRFKGNQVSIRDLVNTPIVVLDFETGVIPKFEKEEYDSKITKARNEYERLKNKYHDNIPEDIDFINPDEIPQPEGRYVVRILHEKEEKKFFTASKDIWSVLDQIKEQGELPFRTVIKAERYGNGGTKYIFT